ncbi:MAG TPA: rhodanese-like domain-containing protein [Stellaceae bacterium]|nr:rhodanese-like domain-containing protein [Stellaceae bacterium]
MAATVKEMLAAANAAIPRLQPDQTRAMLQQENVLLVDVRDPSEVEASGKIKGAVNVSRGMLEFRADPESPYHDPAFQKDKTVLVYCASGGRSALSGKTLKDFGYATVYNAGGFKELSDAGLATEPA